MNDWLNRLVCAKTAGEILLNKRLEHIHAQASIFEND